MKKIIALLLCLALAFSAAGCTIVIDGETTAASSNTTANGSIGLSVSTQNNPFFVTLVEGAEAAAAQLGVSLSVADAGDDVAKQVSDIEDLVSKNISVLYSASPSSCHAQFTWSLPTMAYHHWCAFSCTIA